MPINLDNYEMVKDRLPLFYEKYPKGHITCDILSETSAGVTMKAYLYENWDQQVHQAPLTTGIAHEKPGGFIDKYYENCETSAIGRALANLNMYSKDRPSREEMESADSIRETKKNRPAPAQTFNSSGSNGASPAQIDYMVKLGYEGSTEGITKAEASEYITKNKSK